MNERQANAVADALHGTAWQSGGDIWLVMIPNHEGELIVITDDEIGVYRDEEDFEAGEALARTNGTLLIPQASLRFRPSAKASKLTTWPMPTTGPRP